jgi:hypothetical protein
MYTHTSSTSHKINIRFTCLYFIEKSDVIFKKQNKINTISEEKITSIYMLHVPMVHVTGGTHRYTTHTRIYLKKVVNVI